MTDSKVILIIDDEVDMVTMLKGLLQHKGYCVLTAYNGKEGLQKIAETRPHLIILDINMPQMDGASFYQQIYDHVNKKSKYPVLVLTARANMGSLFSKLDVDGFMTKPFEIDAFLQKVEIIMSTRYGVEESAVVPKDGDESQERETPKRVLVIEDDDEALDGIIRAFTKYGYDISGAENGVEGLEQAMLNPPDIVLIKLRLPDLSGDVVALKLKRMPKTSNIPLVLYQPFDIRNNFKIKEFLFEKMGVDRLIESNDPRILFKECERVWQKKQ